LIIVKLVFFILCLFGFSGRLALGATTEKLNQDLRLRLVAETKDLAGLEQFVQQCHDELSYYIPSTASTADAVMLTIGYDVQLPAGTAKPVLLTSASSREEQAYQIFKAFLLRDFVDQRLQPFAMPRHQDLDWLIAGLTFSCLHGSIIETVRMLPDARPALGLYTGLKPFSLADWIAEPIPPSPSLAYQLYGLNSLHLIGLFNRQPEASVHAWLLAWSQVASGQDAACQLLTPQGKPQGLDAWISKTLVVQLQESMWLTAAELQKQTARLDTWQATQGTAIRALSLEQAAGLIGRETVGKQRLDDYLWLINHTFLFLKPAMRDLADGADHLRKGNDWRSQRAFASGREELAKQLDYSRKVQNYLDTLEAERFPLREQAPTLFRIEDKAKLDKLRHDPALYYWLDAVESHSPAP
jgi:hypothetical protein